jgi:hypothetical protein
MVSGGFFELDVECGAGSDRHYHVLQITSAPAAGFAAFPERPGPPTARKIEYTCPSTGDIRLASFIPPEGFRWPFTITKIQ